MLLFSQMREKVKLGNLIVDIMAALDCSGPGKQTNKQTNKRENKMNTISKVINALNSIDPELIGSDNFAEIIGSVSSGSPNFEVSDYRFISEDEIDTIMQDELRSDSYILGCFNASFLAGLVMMPLSYDSIKKIQEAEGFESIGEIIIGIDGLLEELQEEYVSCDGYGPHFGHYDGEQHELVINDVLYFVFRVD